MSLLKRIESARPGSAGTPGAAPGAPGANLPAAGGTPPNQPTSGRLTSQAPVRESFRDVKFRIQNRVIQDLDPKLDLSNQVEVRDDAALDPELDVAEGLAHRGLADHPLSRGRTVLRPAGRRRLAAVGGRGGARQPARRPGSCALDPLQQGHGLHPFRPSGHDQRHANRDFRGAGLRVSSVTRAGRSPMTDRASSSTSCETWASLLVNTNGTPRLRA